MYIIYIIVFNNSKFEEKNNKLCSRKVRTYISIIKFNGNKLNISNKSKSKLGKPFN